MRKMSSTNFENEQTLTSNTACPFAFALSLVGKRWKPAILWKIAQGVNRFGKLKKEMPAISQKVLAEHLRELERDELIIRQAFAEVPLRVEYHLTPLGRSLEPILDQLNAWGKRAMTEKTAQERNIETAPICPPPHDQRAN